MTIYIYIIFPKDTTAAPTAKKVSISAGKGGKSDSCIHGGSKRGNRRRTARGIGKRKASVTILRRAYVQDKLRINFIFIEEYIYIYKAREVNYISINK